MRPVSRALLNDFTTWELGAIIVGAFVGLGLAGLWLARRLRLHAGLSASNDVTGVILTVLAAIYGVVLAFAVVALYEEFRATTADVHKEATTLALVYRDSRDFPAPAAAAMRRDIGAYIDTVGREEWPALAQGHDSARAWAEIPPIYRTLIAYEPRTEGQRVFYDETVRTVGAFVDARRERISDAESALPTPFVILLVGGGILVLGGCMAFEIDNRRLHGVLTVSVAVLIGFSLLLTLTLEYPFSGEVSVSPSVFHQGALADFASGPAGPPRR